MTREQRRFVISSDRQIIDLSIRPVNGKGHIITAKRAKCIATTGNILVPCSEHMLLLMIGEVWGKREVEKSGNVETIGRTVEVLSADATCK